MDGVNCYVVLTTAPNASVEGIHDRMPLILSHEQVRPWLTDPPAALTLLTIVPPALQKTCEDGQLSFAIWRKEASHVYESEKREIERVLTAFKPYIEQAIMWRSSGQTRNSAM